MSVRSVPKPPPLPPDLPETDNNNTNSCFFKDGIRKIDFIFVYSKTTLDDPNSNTKLRNFVLALEDFGLEMEGENGQVICLFLIMC